MEDYKKDIIIIYHIPVDGYTRQQAQEQVYAFMEACRTGDFYREYFLPYTGGKEQKVKIEIINLKDNKTENIEIKLDKIDDILMKYFEPDKWKRKSKFERIINIKKWK